MDEVDYTKPLPPEATLPKALDAAIEAYAKFTSGVVTSMLVQNIRAHQLPQEEIIEGRKKLHAIRRAFDKEMADLQWQLDQHKGAYQVYSDKTDWVQAEMSSGELSGKYLGMHRADVLKAIIDELRAKQEPAP